MFRQSDALAAYTSPVAYLDAQGITEQLETIATKILTNCEYVKSLGRDGVKDAIFHMLRYTAVCTKHPAFREEKEWRVVASPAMELSSLLLSNMEVIRDVPQTVLKIKLVDHPERGLYGLTPAELIDRVLIGPCAYSQVIQRALQQVLKEAGVPDPETKVYNTGIPLRVNQR